MKNKLSIPEIVLSLLALYLLFINQFMFKSAARIGNKVGISAFTFFSNYFYILLCSTILLLIICIIKKDNIRLNTLALLFSNINISILLIIIAININTYNLGEGFSRISLSLGAYFYIITMYLISVKCNIYINNKSLYFLFSLIAPIILIILLKLGYFNKLAMLIEYNNKKEQFNNELLNHISMAFSVVIVAIIIGLPLGYFSYYKKKFGYFVINILNIFESIPALALICVMMFILSLLNNTIPIFKTIGISGIGAPPVFLALLFYSLFHIVNSICSALKVLDTRYIEVAKGLGMNKKQIFFNIELPIILPIILSGIRVALISSFLAVTIGAYVGFGGLGMFLLQGSAGFAADIILLVSICSLFFILLADFILKEIIRLIEVYRKRKGRFIL